MKISEVIAFLESRAPVSLQEEYDNAGLLIGSGDSECRGAICCIDATEEVVLEAISKNVNLVIAHHPIIFRGLKKINGKNYVEKTIISAIRHDIAIYGIHTNLDNIIEGVNGRIASLLGLVKLMPLQGKQDLLRKIYTFVPARDAEKLRDALFAAGAGNIGNYSECSFNSEGFGTFRAGEGTNPHVGEVGSRHQEPEIKMEMIFPVYKEQEIISALKKSHPYEEPAYDIVNLTNTSSHFGSGIIGQLQTPVETVEFLTLLKEKFGAAVIRHTRLVSKEISRVAICGGAGSFLIPRALSLGADIFITADIKYHEFFEANDRMILADIGHYESEQFTINLLHDILAQKFPTFAVLKTEINTNPVLYF